MQVPTNPESPIVSIMMPAFNSGKYLAESVNSVTRQSFQDWELVIVDDGSTDDTYSIACSFTDPRIRVVRQPNGGEAAARNRALDEIRGRFLAFLDSDDLFLPDHLAQTVRYLEGHPEKDAVYTDGFHIDREGREISPLSSNRRGPFEGRIHEALVRASDVFGPPICVVLRSEKVRKRGLRFDTRIVIGPDWDFMTRLSETAEFGFLDAKTVLYRIHQTNISVVAGMTRRLQSLACCRENSILSEAFSGCSEEVREAVFYDLLINLLPSESERQLEVIAWPQFLALSPRTQSVLLRLMASRAILGRGLPHLIREWLQKARRLDPDSRTTRLLGFLFSASPRLAEVMLRIRRSLVRKEGGNSPFGRLPGAA